MGAWSSNIFPCCQEEIETTTHILKYEHTVMLDVFKNKHSLWKKTLINWTQNHTYVDPWYSILEEKDTTF